MCNQINTSFVVDPITADRLHWKYNNMIFFDKKGLVKVSEKDETRTRPSFETGHYYVTYFWNEFAFVWSERWTMLIPAWRPCWWSDVDFAFVRCEYSFKNFFFNRKRATDLL